MVVHTLFEFGRITSVKGIPRLLRTKSPFMQVVWGVSIVCFLVMATWQAILLTLRYLQYSTVISIQEKVLDLSGTSKTSVRLSDITFCNVNPFATNFTAATDILPIADFLSGVEELTRCDNCTREEELSMEQLQQELTTTRGYMIQIGANNTQRISHQVESFIAACHIWVMYGMQPSTVPCNKVVTIQQYQDSMLYNCYTIPSPANFPPDTHYIGLILVLHLDNYDTDENPYLLSVHPKIRYMNGAVFNFHQSGTPPAFIKDQKLLQPGLFYDFKIRIHRHKRLVKPYGSCVENAGKGNLYTPTNVTYTQLGCWSFCKQKLMYNMCGCIDYNMPVDTKTTNHQRACLAMEYGKQQVLKDWACLRNARQTSAFKCFEDCPLPCEEIKFDTKVRIQITFDTSPMSEYTTEARFTNIV